MGLVVTVALNVAFVPTFGYIACAWAAFGCYGIMMLASYLVGQKKYPINYELGKLALYFIVALALLGIANLLTTDNLWIDFSLRLLLLVAYCGAVLMINRAYSRKTIKG
jgi:O-antigen/teichoic acid export membrane protein